VLLEEIKKKEKRVTSFAKIHDKFLKIDAKNETKFLSKIHPTLFFKKNVNYSSHKAFFGPIFAKLFQIEWKSTIL
jgi:hypothetical protein